MSAKFHKISLTILLLLFSNNIIEAKDNGYVNTPPGKSTVLQGYYEESVKELINKKELTKIEGLWYFPDDLITLYIEKNEDVKFSNSRFAYRLILIDAEDFSLVPGTIMGYIENTAVADKYLLWIYSEEQDGILSRPCKCVATLSDDNTVITYTKPHVNFKIRANFSRFMPSFFKGISITAELDKEKVPHGFSKIYPINKGKFRYL